MVKFFELKENALRAFIKEQQAPPRELRKAERMQAKEEREMSCNGKHWKQRSEK